MFQQKEIKRRIKRITLVEKQESRSDRPEFSPRSQKGSCSYGTGQKTEIRTGSTNRRDLNLDNTVFEEFDSIHLQNLLSKRVSF